MDGFEWDDKKNLANIAKHKVGFDYIAEHFFDDFKPLQKTDKRLDYNEVRRQRIMKIGDLLFFIVYTVRNKKIRIISARKADINEQKIYWNRP